MADFLKRLETAFSSASARCDFRKEEIIEPKSGTFEKRDLPAVVEESVYPLKREEVQPIKFVEHVQTQLRYVTHPLIESRVMPMQVIDQQELASEQLPTKHASTAEADQQLRDAKARYSSWSAMQPAQIERIEHPARVYETTVQNIIEEHQPIIKREVLQPHLSCFTKKSYERIIEAPTISISEVAPVPLNKANWTIKEIQEPTPSFCNATPNWPSESAMSASSPASGSSWTSSAQTQVHSHSIHGHQGAMC